MATYTENYSLVKPGYGDQADIDVLNRLMTDKVDALLFENRRISADEYDQTETYAVGDYAIYENVLYKCLEDTTGNFDPSKWEMTNLAKELATKGGADVTKTASGNPLTFSDGASAPLVNCAVTISPQQDLHGYDKPWVGGAGKNKFDKDNTTSITTPSGAVRNGVYISLTAGTYTVSINPNSAYKLNVRYKTDLEETWSTATVTSTTPTSTITLVSDGQVSLYADSGVLCSQILEPMLESGSTATTFEPYSNICPISGYSSVGVESRGKNLIDWKVNTTANKWQGALFPSTYTLSAESTLTSGNWYFRFSRGENEYPYRASECGLPQFAKASSGWFYGGETYQKITFIVPTGCTLIEIGKLNANGTISAQLEYGSVQTAYEPYNSDSKTYTIALGDTYYSGQIDAVKGVLVATRGYDEFDGTASVTISRSGYSNWYYTIANGGYAGANTANVLSNKYVGAGVTDNTDVLGVRKQSSGSVRVRVGGTEPADVSGFLAELTDTHLQVVYPLTTPLEIPLTPTVISSLLGNNTMWTDGDNLEVEYITEEYQPLVDLIQSEDASLNVFNLWTNTSGASTGTFALSAPIDDFDFISFYYGVYSEYTGSPNIADSRMISAKELKALHESGKNLLLTGYDQRVVYIDAYDSSVTVSVTGDSQVLLAVKGIKIDGGGSSSGTNQHTYSTTEQVVGTWIDGKDVYEKTYTFTATTGSVVTIDADVTFIDTLVSMSGSIANRMGIYEITRGSMGGANQGFPRIDSGELLYYCGSDSDFISGDGYITIRYTKTTTSNTRSLNLTKSAVTEEIPDEIANAEYEEKPDVNEADDDAPTEVDER